MMKINRMRSIKEVFPDDFSKKLEKGYERMEEKMQGYKRVIKSLRRDNSRLKDQVVSLEHVNKKLTHALSKSNTKLEKASARGTGFKSPFTVPKDAGLSFDYKRNTPDPHLAGQLHKMKRSRKSDLLNQVQKASRYIERESGEKKAFADVSSILMEPDHVEDQLKVVSDEEEDLENILEKDEDDSFNEKLGPFKRVSPVKETQEEE